MNSKRQSERILKNSARTKQGAAEIQSMPVQERLTEQAVAYREKREEAKQRLDDEAREASVPVIDEISANITRKVCECKVSAHFHTRL